jgi:hypothetical protein
MLTREQSAWAKKLQKLLAAMPEGIELIVGRGEAAVMETTRRTRVPYAGR